ncbi:MAG: hypothetical protein EXR11_09135 [Rhodospirillaceae bacterium]|nr:hypothetical protein [Rhodospirillaceae bacterium]
MHIRSFAARALMLSTVSLVGLSAPSFAQQAERTQVSQATALEEIVVTSRKREEKLLDIPISVTVFSAQDIQKAQIFDMRQISKLAPGAYMQTVGGNGAGRYIPILNFRGLTSANSLPRIQTGAVFMDGIYILGGVNAVNTTDVQRVEVLKGPQNAYFGRNTFGGAINFITRNPGDEYAGEINATGSTRNSYDMNLSFEGPLVSGKLAARTSLLTHKKGAHYTALDGGKLGEETTKSASATLYATPSDNAWLRFRGYYQRDEDSHGPLAHLSGPLHGNNSCAGRTFQGFDAVTKAPRTFALSIPYICGHIPTVREVGAGVISVNTNLRSPRLASLGNPNGLINAFVNNSLNDPLIARAPKLDHFGILRNITRLTGQGQFTFENGISLNFNAGYDDTKTMGIFDSDRSNEENIYGAAPALSKVKHFEARIESDADQKLRWMIGGNLYDGDFYSSYGGGGSVLYQSRTAPNVPFNTAPVSALTPGALDANNGELAKVKAVFGSLEYDITEQLSLQGEIRYQKDQGRLTSAPGLNAAFKDWLPRVIVNYKPVEDWTLYASWARGVLPGTFNGQYATASAFHRGLIEAAFPGVTNLSDSDKLDSFEIGSKQQLFDGRFQYTLAAYKMTWSNLKATAAFVVPTTLGAATTFTFTGIIVPGDAKLKGIEWESTAILTDQWDVNLKASYQTGKYTNFVQPFLAQLTSNVTRFDGNHLARVPNVSASLASTYRNKFVGDWDWFLRGDVNYTGRAWDSEANILKSDPYYRINARIGVETETLSIELYATNLFDNRDWDYSFRNVFQGSAGSIFQALPTGFGFPAFGFPQGIFVGVPDKRDFGLRIKYNF